MSPRTCGHLRRQRKCGGCYPPPHYPQHEKMAKIADQSQEIGRFLDEFLPGKGIVLAHVPECYDHTLVPYSYTINTLLAEFYDIDLAALEDEKRAMLARLRMQGENHVSR